MKKSSKKLKQILSVFLAIMLIVTIMPLSNESVAAKTVSDNSKIILGENGEITRAEWLHDLVTVFGMTVESGAEPDNYFSDLDDSHEYYSDMILAVEFGVVDVEAGEALYPDRAVTRDFAASTLNFCLGYQVEEGTEYTFTDYEECSSPDDAQIAVERGWLALADGKFNPSAYITETEVETMLNDASSILESTTVDENYDSTYDFEDDVVVVPNGTLVTEEDGVISITDCTEEIVAGSKFAVYFNEIPNVYTATSVTQDGDITIIETETVESDEAFADVDAQGVVAAEEMQFEAAEGVEMEFEEETNSASTYAARATKKIKTIKLNTDINLVGGMKLKANIKIKDPKVEYSINSKYAYASLIGETEITYTLSGSLTDLYDSRTVTVLNCNIAGIGSFSIDLNFDLSGSASSTVKGNLTAGLECEKGGQIRAIKSFKQKEYYSNVDATASVSIKAKLGITKLPVISAYVYAEVGVEAKLKKTSYSQGSPSQCVHFAAYLFFKYGASASAKFGIWKTSFDVTYDVYTASNSPVRIAHHYENGKEVPSCTRGVDYTFGKYFTRGTSRYGGSGWMGANGAYGLNADGTPFVLYEYELDEDNNAIITQYNGNSNSVYIPDEIDGYTVVGIGYGAFEGKDVVNVVIPDTVTDIGNRAFSGCTALNNVNLSYSLKSIGYDAFFNCDSLEKINIPKSLESAYFDDYYTPAVIYYTPFRSCDSLKTIEFEKGITSIIPNLFWNCTGLEKVEIPDTVTNIGANAFRGCSNLKETIIPDAVTDIGNRAFSGCTELSKVNLSYSLKSIGYDAFFNCDSLEKINIPKLLESAYFDDYYTPAVIYYTPFRSCDSLKTIEFEKGITSIIPNLFWNCTGLEKVEIPDTVTNIGANAFRDCSNLKEVIIPAAVTDIGNRAFSGCTELSKVNLSYSLKSIGYDAFFNCDSLEKINIPKSLESAYFDDYYTPAVIYYTPFRSCDSLKTIEFEKGITSIIPNLFWNCTGLEKVEIPDTVTNIGANAFRGCSNLKEAIIPDAVTDIENNAFHSCVSLSSVTIPNSVTTINQYAFYNCKELKTIDIPDSVISMGEYIFDGCSSLESVKLPNKCINIMGYMFRNCSSLKTIEFPSTVEKIQNSAFYGCTSLESFTFENNESSLKEVASYAFYGCSSLKEAKMPETVSTIGNNAFQNCIALQKAYIPQSTKNIGSSTFMGCETLSDVTISDYSITKINSNTFKDCPGLASIVLPKGLTTIGSQAFMNDTSLTSVTIPESVTSIDSTAFSYPAKTTILGTAGSYPETFANDGGFTFKNISVPSEGIALVDGVENITLDVGESYRAKFEWYPDDSTDVITLTANNTKVGISGHDITAKSIGDTVITATATSGVTYEFNIHIRNASKIAVLSVPNKVSYIMGEELDLTGMAVQVTYNDGSVREVTDYTVSGFDSSVEGENTVTVSWKSAYGSTYKTTFTVEIVDPSPKVTGIVIDTMPTKLQYERKESLDLSGMVVKANYTDGSKKEITDYTVSGYNALKNGVQTITVTYGDFTTTFTVTVGQVETTEPETTAEQTTTEKSTTETQTTTEPLTTDNQETTESESRSEELTTMIPSTTEEPTTEKQTPTTTVPITDKPTDTTVQASQPTTTVVQTTTTTKVSVGATKIKSSTKKKSAKKVKISLKKVKGVTGYQVKISTTKKFTKKKTITKNFKKNVFTVKKLKANKKYFVKARCYKVVKGKKYYGAWTKVKQVKIK